MKLKEETFLDDGKLIVKETHDFNPTLQEAAELRSNGLESYGESKLVGLIPMKLWAEWAKEAGIKTDDPAMKEVIARKMADPDFSQFRVWGGRY